MCLEALAALKELQSLGHTPTLMRISSQEKYKTLKPLCLATLTTKTTLHGPPPRLQCPKEFMMKNLSAMDPTNLESFIMAQTLSHLGPSTASSP